MLPHEQLKWSFDGKLEHARFLDQFPCERNDQALGAIYERLWLCLDDRKTKHLSQSRPESDEIRRRLMSGHSWIVRMAHMICQMRKARLVGTQTTAYVSGMSYAPQGAPSQYTYGNGVSQLVTYIRASAAVGGSGWNRVKGEWANAATDPEVMKRLGDTF